MKIREQEIERAKELKEMFSEDLRSCYDEEFPCDNIILNLRKYRILSKQGNGSDIINIKELENFIETGKTKEERDLIEMEIKNDKIEKREKLKIFREWATLIIAVWAFIRTFK